LQYRGISTVKKLGACLRGWSEDQYRPTYSQSSTGKALGCPIHLAIVQRGPFMTISAIWQRNIHS